jgi:hypothetical protein
MKISDLVSLARTAAVSRDIDTLSRISGAIGLEYTKRRSRLDLAEELSQSAERFECQLARYREVCGAERARAISSAYSTTALQSALPTDEDYLDCDRLELIELVQARVNELEANPLRDRTNLYAALNSFANQAPDIEISHGILVATGFVTETQLCFI